MEISARVTSSGDGHEVSVETEGNARPLAIPGRTGGGSAVNGGELLFLALATCYCNDVYREAAAKGLRVDAVDVRVTGRFGGRGEPASDVRYAVSVVSPESQEAVAELLRVTDTVAEVQNTLRGGVAVELTEVRSRPTD